MKLAILFGGSSLESDVSVVSATSIIKNLDKNKYKIKPIYLDKSNNFYLWKENVNKINTVKLGYVPDKLKLIKEPFSYLKKFDLVFIMIHGKNGEDGTLSAIFDFLNISYIGNEVLPSVISMDKILTKQVLEYHKIKTSPYIYFTKYNNEYLYLNKSVNFNEIKDIIKKKISLPIFIKPSNSGSSIGVSKVVDYEGIDEALIKAFKIDKRVLVEKEVSGKEVECGILEHDSNILASVLGEVLKNDYYSFEEKYNNKWENTIIPCNIDEDLSDKIKKIAIKAFKVLNLHGYSRVDFFITDDGEIILNEINTIPGFTDISMYPKLFEASNISYSTLLDILIDEARKK